MEDADKALKLNKQNPKAILAKAEALYNMGQFENALVQFERGWRVRQDPEIRTGIVKCRDVIMNTVGTTAKEYDREVVEKVIQQMKDMQIKKESELEKNKGEKKKKKKDPDQLLLGKMNEDVKFLEDFLKSQKTQRPRSGYQVLQGIQRKLLKPLLYISSQLLFVSIPRNRVGQIRTPSQIS